MCLFLRPSTWLPSAFKPQKVLVNKTYWCCPTTSPIELFHYLKICSSVVWWMPMYKYTYTYIYSMYVEIYIYMYIIYNVLISYIVIVSRCSVKVQSLQAVWPHRCRATRIWTCSVLTAKCLNKIRCVSFSLENACHVEIGDTCWVAANTPDTRGLNGYSKSWHEPFLALPPLVALNSLQWIEAALIQVLEKT